MADTLVGQGFDEQIGTRFKPGQTQAEYYNKQSGEVFGTPLALSSFVNLAYGRTDVNEGNVFNALGQGFTPQPAPLKVEAPSTVPAKVLEQPTSRYDVDSLIQENDKIMQQLQTAAQPTAQETTFAQNLAQLQDESRNLQLNAQDKSDLLGNQGIIADVATRQQDEVGRQANVRLSRNALQQQGVAAQLGILQQNRQALMQSYQLQLQYGQQNIDNAFKKQQIQMQLDQVAREEQQAARDFSLKYNVQAPAYSIDGKTVYNTQTGRPYTNENDFFRDFGFKSWAEVPKDFIQRDFTSDEERQAAAQMATQREQFGLNYGLEKEKLAFDKTVTLRELGLKEAEFALKQAELALEEGKGDPKATMDILTKYLGESKSFLQVKEAFVRIQAAAKDPSAAGDLALIFNYMKILDPGSVVREGEFATAQNSAGVPDQIRNAYNKALNGQRLNENQRNDFVDRSQRLYNAQANQHSQIRKIYENLANNTPGVDIEVAVPDLSEVPGAGNKDAPPLSQMLSNPVVFKMARDLQAQGITDSSVIEELIHEKLGYKKKMSSAGNVDRIAEAIGSFESGGRYTALGPVTKNGDRAYGKYQVMGSNIPSWTKAALGKSLTPQQFLKDQKAQDAVARYKMAILYKKYGTVEDVASVWFSGRPAKGNNSKDIIGTSVPKYITGVRSLYNKLS
jgi:hypothetical protein